MEQVEPEPAGNIETGQSYCAELPVKANPMSSTEVYQVIESIHRTIVGYIKVEKPTRGFAYSTLPGGELVYHTLLELQEDADLIGCNSTVFTDLLELVGTYDFRNEYVFVIRVDKEELTRFVVNIAPLDENQVGAIKTLEEVKAIETATLLVEASRRANELRSGRSGSKRKTNRKDKVRLSKGFAKA